MAFAKPNTTLSPLLNQWKNLLQQWAKGGSLATAAQEALLLSGIPEGLQILISEWEAANFKSLPEVELLSAVDISGAMGAYAISTGKIYLNENWLYGARKEDVFAVLIEELGHHLDAVLNKKDTPGDEGQLFAALLTSNFNVSDSEKESLQAEADHGIAMIFGNEVAVEQSGLPEVSVAATANGKETDGSPVVFTFTRSGSTSAALSINYQLFGTAQAGSDYTVNTTGTINFAAGSSSATLSLPAIADGALIDPYETIIARINPATNYEIATGKQFATATITAEGMVVIPRGASYPGRSSGEYGNDTAFAALKSDGSVVSWGYKNLDWSIDAPAGLTGITQIFSNEHAFAALKSDGSVISWGDIRYGGSAPAGLTGVTKIYSTYGAFAALKNDGSVVSWGGVAAPAINGIPILIDGVSKIFSTNGSFAALKNDGTVVSWGSNGLNASNAPTTLTGVSQIFSTDYAFAALKNDGSVVSWGNNTYGGDAPAGLTAVNQIFSTSESFAALKSDGSVISWGDNRNADITPKGLTGVTQIFSNPYAFAALKRDGSVISWGKSSSARIAPAGLTGVSQIFSTSDAFAALKSDGSVISWGVNGNGEANTAPAGLTGVSQIFSTSDAFAALKSDGSVVSWGDSRSGGSAPAGLTGVTQIFSTSGAFSALKGDGSVVSWGDSTVGGVAPAGLTDVVGFANPYADDRLLIGATPTYTFTPSGASINEGAMLTSTVTTTNIATGTKLYYALNGSGIYDADFSAGTLTGEGTTDSAGKFTFTHTLANDLITEGTESLEIKLYQDSSFTFKVGDTVIVLIADSSVKPAIGTPLSFVSVIAIAHGNEADGSPVVFSFGRTGDTNTALSVSYQLFGTAQAGSDYTGNTTGTINFAAGSSNATLSLPALADGALNDPYETIIARINPATNYEIATGKQFATATITAEGMVVIPRGISRPGASSGELRNNGAFAALKSDGTVVCWGDNRGGIAPAGLTGVIQIFSNPYAFAALKSDGSVVSWGDSGFGGNPPAGLSGGAPASLTGVNQIFSTRGAFAALKRDGTVVCWGNNTYGGSVPTGLTGVSQIFSIDRAFTALKSDGSVVSWGYRNAGFGFGPLEAPEGLSGISKICSNTDAFAALKNDGSVVSWGDWSSGGNNPAGLTGISQIFSTDYAFAALKADGSVISWGNIDYGGNSPAGLTGVSQIFSTGSAFAALKSDGSVICWGATGYGGNTPAGLTGVSQIFSNSSAFAALMNDGSVVSWGSKNHGGSAPLGLTGVSQIFSNQYAFAALKNDGSVISWGKYWDGSKYAEFVAPVGLTGVSQIFSTGGAFAALKSDGSVISWGKHPDGGNSADVISPAGLTGVVGFANPSTDDRLVISATPTYTLTPSLATINEGAVLTSTVTTTNVATGTKLYYALSGTGITTADFSTSTLIGEGITDATGKFTFTHTLANDLITEGAEMLSIKLYSDVARTLQVGSTATVNVVDSSTTPVPTYTLTTTGTTINEGAVLTSTVTTTNVAIGNKLYYALSGTGITTADFSAGALRGEGIIDSTGKLSFSNTLANDITTEGVETLEIKLFSDEARLTQLGSTASVSINDISINPFNLDIDGDGKVTALGDGLMVIRKLFGAAFTGDALTNKAISPTATRTAAEIHQFIESGISTGTLDVDKDGKTTALGDGLMVIRHLFGAAFAGAALTNKAISPDSPYFGTPVDHLTIANTIDSMKLIPALST